MERCWSLSTFSCSTETVVRSSIADARSQLACMLDVLLMFRGCMSTILCRPVYATGLSYRHVCRHDSVARSLLEDAVVYMVPCMNPDGAWRGLLRCNAAGMNLNRCWQDSTLAESPEVYFTLQKMRETGVDMLVDVHGDETIPANFIAYSEGIPGWSDKMADCRDRFSSFLKVASPDFQTVRSSIWCMRNVQEQADH